jgi:hypothetical protein
MQNAPSLLAFAAMMSPEVAALDLQPDGEPVLLDLPQTQAMGEQVYAALGEDALALSVGDKGHAKLADMLEAEAGENGTIFNFSMDANRYYTFIGEAMMQADNDDENPMSPKFQAAMQDVMLAIADMYDRMTVDMRVSEDGIVFDSVVILAE